jgi:hypothetical protein
MTGASLIRAGLALTIAIVIVVGCAAAMLADGSTDPAAFVTPGAMAGWHCSKTMGILTVCTRLPRATPASDCPPPRRTSQRPA